MKKQLEIAAEQLDAEVNQQAVLPYAATEGELLYLAMLRNEPDAADQRSMKLRSKLFDGIAFF